MDDLTLINDGNHQNLKGAAEDISRHIRIMQGAAQVMDASVASLQGLIASFEAQRSLAFLGWMIDNDFYWCGMCENTCSSGQAATHLIEIFSTTDEGYRCDRIHSEIASVCEGCQANRRKSRRPPLPLFSCSRFTGAQEHDLTPACAGPGVGKWSVLRPTQVPKNPAWKHGRMVDEPPAWTPLADPPAVRSTPEFVSDEYAARAQLPPGIKLYLPQRAQLHTLAQGRQTIVFDGK